MKRKRSDDWFERWGANLIAFLIIVIFIVVCLALSALFTVIHGYLIGIGLGWALQ